MDYAVSRMTAIGIDRIGGSTSGLGRWRPAERRVISANGKGWTRRLGRGGRGGKPSVSEVSDGRSCATKNPASRGLLPVGLLACLCRVVGDRSTHGRPGSTRTMRGSPAGPAKRRLCARLRPHLDDAQCAVRHRPARRTNCSVSIFHCSPPVAEFKATMCADAPNAMLRG